MKAERKKRIVTRARVTTMIVFAIRAGGLLTCKFA